MTTQINFPQVPFIGPDGYVSFEWQQWLLNPQVLEVIFQTAVGVPSGGTGLTSGTPGGVLAFLTSTTMASSGVLGADEIVLGGGAGAVPETLGDKGTSIEVLHGNAAGPPTFGPVVAADAPTLVPYTGATTGLNLGSQTLAAGNATLADITGTTLDVSGAAEVETIETDAPTGGAGVWRLGIANAVSPTSPNRTVTISIGGTTYYLAAKTTND